jgi:hypothetical protein
VYQSFQHSGKKFSPSVPTPSGHYGGTLNWIPISALAYSCAPTPEAVSQQSMNMALPSISAAIWNLLFADFTLGFDRFLLHPLRPPPLAN